MSVTEAVRVYRGKVKEKSGVDFRKTILEHSVNFVLGVLFSFSGFSKDFSPFGVAFTASASKNCTITAGLGAVVGYFITLDSVTALRYTASVLALCVVMSALKPFKQLRDNPFTPVAVVFVCLLVTGLAIAFSQKVELVTFLLCFAESALGGASAFVFSKSRGVISLKGGLSMLTSKEATAVVISLTLLLLSLRDLSVYGVYPVHIITQVLILICAYYCREAGGAIVGICGGLTMSLGTENVFLLGFYALGGLLSGAFSAFGRIATFVAFAFSGVTVTAIAFRKAEVLPVLIETAVSGILFIALTIKFNDELEKVFLPSVTSPVIDSVKSGIIGRLKNASEISSEIYTSLTTVNEAISKTDKTDVEDILKKTREQVCGSCGLYDVCWKEGREQTVSSFRSLLELKKQGVYLENKTIPQQFASACIRSENISSSFNKLYAEYKINEANQTRISEMYNLASQQFVNVSALLDSVCDDMSQDLTFDMDVAARVRAAAVSCGFEPLEACCIIDSVEKMTVELKIKIPYDKTAVKNFSSQLDIITKRRLELPEIEYHEAYAYFVYKEKSPFKVVSAGVQFNADGEKFSGDSFTTFEDKKGYFYAIICDGMGTGTKAAVSSNLAVNLLEKLIKAGFGIQSSVNTVNTSLISKSGDECSVTLDLAVFDLFTGRIEFYKCGASDSIVKRNGKITDVGFCSLPLGIISEADMGCGCGALNATDVVVMCSDGIRAEDMGYLKRSLKEFRNGSVRNFTTDVCENIRRMQGEKKDDMTVLTLAIIKND